MNQYLLTYTPPRASFPEDATPMESAAVEQHFVYLSNLLKAGLLIIAGRTEDAEFGMAVFEAADDEAAAKIMAGDPALQVCVFSGVLKRFQVALLAGAKEDS